RLVDRRVNYIRVLRHPSRDVEMHRIAAKQTTLAELLELDTLYLKLLEALTEHHMPAVLIRGIGHHRRPLARRGTSNRRVRKRVTGVVAFRDDPDAARQQGNGGTGFGCLQI